MKIRKRIPYYTYTSVFLKKGEETPETEVIKSREPIPVRHIYFDFLRRFGVKPQVTMTRAYETFECDVTDFLSVAHKI